MTEETEPKKESESQEKPTEPTITPSPVLPAEIPPEAQGIPIDGAIIPTEGMEAAMEKMDPELKEFIEGMGIDPKDLMAMGNTINATFERMVSHMIATDKKIQAGFLIIDKNQKAHHQKQCAKIDAIHKDLLFQIQQMKR